MRRYVYKSADGGLLGFHLMLHGKKVLELERHIESRVRLLSLLIYLANVLVRHDI